MTQDFQSVTCLYVPQFLTTKQENHCHFFIGTEPGRIFVFDIETKMFASFVIEFPTLKFTSQMFDIVSDMKCHWQKMHRLLISYKNTAVVVFSLNKNRNVQVIELKEDQGQALSAEWCIPDCTKFIVGYSTGIFDVFNASDRLTNNKPVRSFNIDRAGLNSIRMTMYNRPKSHYFLIITISRTMRDEDLQREEQNKIDDSGITMAKDYTETIVKKGNSEMNDTIYMDKLLPDKKDSSFLVTSGIFQLYEKYHTINQVNFMDLDDKSVEITGADIVKELKNRHSSLALYNGFLLITMTKNLKMLYFNLDAFVIQDMKKFD